MDTVLLIARLALAAVFVVAGIAKLFDLAGSRTAVRDFGVPERFAKPVGLALPVAEIAIGAFLLPVTTAKYAAIAGTVLMLVFMAAIANNLRQGKTPDCHCFGQLHSEPAGPRTLIRNGIFAAIGAFIAIAGWNDAGYSLTGWAGDRSTFDWVVLAAVSMLLIAVAGVAWLMVHIWDQNGRLLIKIDELETKFTELPQGSPAGAPAPAANAAPQPGLPVGSPAPAFKLDGIHGETITLDALRAQGKQLLLLFSDPNCGPCNALLPEIGSWQRDQAASFTTVVISRGSITANQEKAKSAGLGLVFLQKSREVAESYQAIGTPSAVIVRPDGAIGSPVAGGADRIRELVRSLTGAAPPLQPAPMAVPNGAPQPAAANGGSARPAPPQPSPTPAIGAAAPDLNLSDLDGTPVALSSLRDTDSVLIFWSPTCGFCRRMADDITAWENDPPANAPKAIIITSGDIEANRAFGFKSTILNDPGTEAMRLYGTGGTPTAIKIDRSGKIASELRVGQPGVMSLLRNEPAPAGAQPPKAIQIGEPAPAVKLPDLAGNQFELSSLKGKKAAVVFWNPGCGFCNRMLDDLKAWESSKPADAPELVLVSTGTVEANAQQGLRSTVLIDQGFSVGQKFGASGTPSAVLIDEEGKVASGVAVGAPRVLELAGAPQPV